MGAKKAYRLYLCLHLLFAVWLSKVVLVQLCTDVLGRLGGEGVVLDKVHDGGFIVEQAVGQVQEPGILLVGAESRKPHLPVQTRLVGGYRGTDDIPQTII